MMRLATSSDVRTACRCRFRWGLVNSAYTTFGDDFPTTIWGYIPVIPMFALAVAEMGRIPLCSVIFHKRRYMQVVAALGICALGYLAVENWVFGFERIVELRLKLVNPARRNLDIADANLKTLLDQRTATADSGDKKREELRKGLAQRTAAIKELTEQSAAEDKTHLDNMTSIKEVCRISPVGDHCNVDRLREESARHDAEKTRIAEGLRSANNERASLQKQIDVLVSSDAGNVSNLGRKIALAEAEATEAREKWQKAIDGNQIYRIAAMFFHVHTADVTPAQFAVARQFFSIFSAISVALAGTIAALVYYADNRGSGESSTPGRALAKLINARRAFYNRKRRPLRVAVPGPERVVYRDGKEAVIVEKEIPRIVEHIVLIPRRGIKDPVHINNLIKGNQASDSGTSATLFKRQP